MDRSRRPFKAVAWVCWIADSTVPLRLGSRTRAAFGDDAIVPEHFGIDRVECRSEDVGLMSTFLEVVENDVLDDPAEIAKGFFMQARPGFAAGSSRPPWERTAGVA
ncbi:MAG: hypothetical protein IPG34_15620 [Rhodocyclaceae bacterium]|nr:hypothetical protein [Rhodocyclaceae bacterium]